MRDILKMIIVLSSICSIAGFALSYLKLITEKPIEDQVLTYVQKPALNRVFIGLDKDPVAERKQFTLKNGRAVMVFPAIKDGKLVGVALEDASEGFGGDINVMVGINTVNDTLIGIGITTMKETPGIGDVITRPSFTDKFVGQKKEVALQSEGGTIDAISGATISSAATVIAVAKAAKVYDELKEQIFKTWP